MHNSRLFACILALAISACTPSSAESWSAKGRSTAHAPVLILDGDSRGAVVLDSSKQAFIGVERGGRIAWQLPVAPEATVPIGCLAQCPDAAFSASPMSIDSSHIPDPVPMVSIDGALHTLETAPLVKRQLLAARSTDDFVLVTGNDRSWWIEIHRAKTIDRIAVAGFRTSWKQSADGSEVLAITITDQENHGDHGNEARWFSRRNGAWKSVGPVSKVSANTACLAPNGQRALLLGQRPTLLDHEGRQTPISDLEQAGTCAWSNAGGIIADLAQGSAGARAWLRTFDNTGRITSRLALLGKVTVSANAMSFQVAYTHDNVLVEIDPRTGTEVRTLSDVSAARYTPGGELIVALMHQPSPKWLPASSIARDPFELQ